MDKPLKSAMNGQCNARPMVTFPAAENHCQIILPGDRGAHVLTTCSRLLLESARLGAEPMTVESQVQHPNHYTSRPDKQCSI